MCFDQSCVTCQQRLVRARFIIICHTKRNDTHLKQHTTQLNNRCSCNHTHTTNTYGCQRGETGIILAYPYWITPIKELLAQTPPLLLPDYVTHTDMNNGAGTTQLYWPYATMRQQYTYHTKQTIPEPNVSWVERVDVRRQSL